jgi:Zn-finger nucleic acid-binding protein
MKILVDREDIDNARIALAQIRHGIVSSEYTESQVLDLAIQADDCLLKILRDNPEPTKSNCKICGIETNSNDSCIDINYCPRCWNQRLVNKHITKDEYGRVTVTGSGVTPKAVWSNPTNKPSDITDEDRKWADKEIERHDDSQIPVRSKEQNIQAIKDAITNHTNNVTDRHAIIEILDMLAEFAYSKCLHSKVTLGDRAADLASKLVGEK